MRRRSAVVEQRLGDAQPRVHGHAEQAARLRAGHQRGAAQAGTRRGDEQLVARRAAEGGAGGVGDRCGPAADELAARRVAGHGAGAPLGVPQVALGIDRGAVGEAPLADEIEMVRRYLAIMQARLGPRLASRIDVAEDLAAELPPGIVLTLVENAIAHGIEPQLRGGHVEVTARRDGDRVVVTVRDDGPGLAPGWAEGVGLSNTRRRLTAALPNATLTLTDAAPGCEATLTL
ncbi:ATPase/histidine kinase/DNA gyrase B/HSP90 domain protein [Ostertagia ostertagi]